MSSPSSGAIGMIIAFAKKFTQTPLSERDKDQLRQLDERAFALIQQGGQTVFEVAVPGPGYAYFGKTRIPFFREHPGMPLQPTNEWLRMMEHFRATVEPEGRVEVAERQREQARRDAARKQLDRLAAAECRDEQELSRWCRDALECLNEFVRLDGRQWNACSTPAQRLALAAQKHANELGADADTLQHFAGLLPSDRSEMTAATGKLLLQRLSEWCGPLAGESTPASGPADSKSGAASDDPIKRRIADEEAERAEARRREREKEARLRPYRDLRPRWERAFEEFFNWSGKQNQLGRCPSREGFLEWACLGADLGDVLNAFDILERGGAIARLRAGAESGVRPLECACLFLLRCAEGVQDRIAECLEALHGNPSLQQCVNWLPFVRDALWRPHRHEDGRNSVAEPPDGVSFEDYQKAGAAFGWKLIAFPKGSHLGAVEPLAAFTKEGQSPNDSSQGDGKRPPTECETRVPDPGFIQTASDVPDLGTAQSVHEFWSWCNRHREGLQEFRVRSGLPPPASVAPNEFRVIPEIVRRCRQHLLGFGASDIPERFEFPDLPRDQTPSGPEHFPSEMEGFVSWASGYRSPGHGILKLIGDVEDFLTWAMGWCQQQRSLEREQAPPTDVDPLPPLPEQWFFAPSGNGYFVAGFGESGHLSGLKGLSDIAPLIRSPGKAVSMLDLEGVDKLKRDRRSRQPAAGAEELQNVSKQLQELRADLERAQEENDTVEADVAQREIQRLEASLAAVSGLGGRIRDLNNLFDKLRPKIYGRLRTVYEAMRKADPPMKQLAEHFEASIACEGGSGFVYRPAGNPPPWNLQRTSEK
jgi:hypothetical protein